MDKQIIQIPLSKIKANPNQPRKLFDEDALEELSLSIKSYGVLQPVTVRTIAGGYYELIAGERRLRASEKANMETIASIVVDYENKDSAIIALMENLQREDLNYIEEAYGYNNLILDHNMTQGEIAKKLGKSQSTIGNKLRLLKLSSNLQKTLIEEKLTERHARALLKLPEEIREEFLVKVIEKNYNVKQTDKLVEEVLQDLSKVEEVEIKPNMKGLINTKIYVNTLKNAYKAIVDSGLQAKYKETDKGDYVEVTVQIPKS